MTLKRKEKTLSIRDDYGIWDYDKWFDELDYFYDNIVKDSIHTWSKKTQNPLTLSGLLKMLMLTLGEDLIITDLRYLIISTDALKTILC